MSFDIYIVQAFTDQLLVSQTNIVFMKHWIKQMPDLNVISISQF